MKQSILTSMKKLGSQNRMLTFTYTYIYICICRCIYVCVCVCPTGYKNVQYQETDQNQINELPTWGILFNKTLTKEDDINTIIKVIILSAKRERE